MVANTSQRVVIAGSFIIEPLRSTLSFWLRETSLPFHVRFAPYNHIYQTLLQRTDSSEVLILIMREEELAKHREQFLKSLKEAQGSAVYVLVCPSDPLFNEDSEMKKMIEEVSGAHYLYVPQWFEPYFVKSVFNPYMEKMADMPFEEEVYVLLGTLVARILYALHVPRIKLIAVDCDQTLWKGVLAEESISMHVSFQQWLQNLSGSGTPIALFSKNEEKDVRKVFDAQSEMPLKSDHILAWCVNWDNKGKNLRALTDELNIGADAVLFLDDNPLECAIVEAAVPHAAVILFDPHAYLHIWEIPLCSKRTEEDGKRSKMYLQHRQREQFKAEAGGFEAFIQSLHLQVEIKKAEESDFKRVIQLMQRTNQFNTNPGRKSSECSTYIVKAQDRFGDYGIVGVLLVQERNNQWIVDGWYLSCRALGKGIEHQTASWIGKNAPCQQIAVLFCKSTRNQPALNFLHSLPCIERKEECFLFEAEALAQVHFDGKQESFSVPLVEGLDASASLPIQRSVFARLTMSLNSVEAIQKSISKFEHPLHEAVLSHLSSLIRRDQIGLDDHLFALGLDSFDAAVLSYRLHKAFNKPVDISDIFNHPTISELCDHIEKMPACKDVDCTTPMREIPLTGEQTGIWYGWAASSEKSLYMIHVPFQIKGKHDLKKLDQAVCRLKQRYDLLHVPLQLPFKGPEELFTYSIVEIDECTAWVDFSFHHLICDEKALSLFMQELSHFYNYPDAQLPQAGSYAKYSCNQVRTIPESTWEFWKQELSWSTIPLGPQRAAKEQIFKIRSKLQERIKSMAVRNYTTPFVVLMTLFAQSIKSVFREERFYIATPFSTRPNEHTFGLFVNVFPFAVNLSRSAELEELLVQHQRKLAHLSNHRHTSFYQIQEKLGHALTPAYAFNWIRTEEQTPRLSGLEVMRIDERAKYAEYDLTCTIEEGEDAYTVQIVHAYHNIEQPKADAVAALFLKEIQCL